MEEVVTKITDKKQEVDTKLDERYFTQHDIYATQGRRGLLLEIKKEYDPKQFWDDLGEKYFNKFNKQEQLQQHLPWILDRLRVIKPDTFLDVGCGFGRILPFLLDSGVVKSAHGVDIAQNILKSSKKYLEPKNITVKDKNGNESSPPDFRDRIKFQLSDVRSLDLKYNSFDCVLTCEVLQHLHPRDIKKACSELMRVTKHAVICIERWGFPGEHSEPHLWSHELVREFTALGFNVVQATSVAQTTQGVIVFK